MSRLRNPIDRFALGRQLTRAANASVGEILAGFSQTAAHAATRIAFTGPPGTGKSSLVSRLCRRHLDAGRRVGVLAVDPTSPFTSGAILGDRIRMESVSDHVNLFIRSLASRGAHNGLADNIPELLMTMDAHDFDEVIVETVGVGQVECAVRDLVDTTVLVLNPASGDHIQAMKAGVLEAADIILVNKADLPGADQILAALHSVISARQYGKNAWVPSVLKASHQDDAGLEDLDRLLGEHATWSHSMIDPVSRRRARRSYHLSTLLARRGAEVIEGLPTESLDAGLGHAFHKLLESLR
jgi:LAO/AO transport system kinase